MNGRVVGVDLARCLALVGMIVAHLMAPDSFWFDLVAGRSAALFAVLAGLSLSLSARPRPGRSPAQARLALVARAGAVALIGLMLGMFTSGIAVILTFYGVLFLVGIPLITWRATRLALLAGVLMFTTPVVSLLLRGHLPASSNQVPHFGLLADPVQLLTELTVTGYYPVLTWSTYLVAGMALGRVDLSSARARTWLLAGGAALSGAALLVSAVVLGRPGAQAALVESWDRPPLVQNWEQLSTVLDRGLYGVHPTGAHEWLWLWVPHSGSVVTLAHTVGTSLLVLGCCLWLVAVVGPVMERALAVASGAGRMTLTMYTAHVLVASVVLAGWGQSVWVHLASVLVVGALCVLTGRRGPLESMVGAAAGRAARQA